MRLIALILISFCIASPAALPPEYESAFTQANMAYQQNQMDVALQWLDQILVANPEQVEALELKALILKQMGQLEASGRVYAELFQNASKWGAGDKLGLYGFELGSVAAQIGDAETARTALKKAIRLKTNVEASHFTLGKLEWEQNNWKTCREHFEAASESPVFKTASQFYIASAFKKDDRATDALGAYVEAKESAELELARADQATEKAKLLAQEVLKTAAQELRSFDRAAWMGEVGTSSAYDSNVLFMPTTADGANTATSGSFKQSLNWKLRYASSPVTTWQYLGTYQGAINHNFNRDTTGGQFFVHDISQFITRGFLKKQHIGIKVGASGIMQYRENAYRPFSLAASFGPFLKSKINEDYWFGLEAFTQPTKNYLDPSVNSNAKRSGWEQNLRAYISSAKMNTYWSPAFLLTHTVMRLDGTEFSGSRWNVDLTNAMYLTPSLFLAQTLNFVFASYPNRDSGGRSDQGATLGVSGGYQLMDGFTVMAQVDYGKNLSTDANFQYDRWTSTLSGNYRF